MATRTEIRQMRLSQSRRIIEEKNASGLTISQFCKMNNITRDSYFYWQNLVRQEALSKMKQPEFVELQLPAVAGASLVNTSKIKPTEFTPKVVVSMNNATVQIDSNTPRELLEMILEVLANVK